MMLDALDNWMRAPGYCWVRQCLALDSPGTAQSRLKDRCVRGMSVIARFGSENRT